ncbi:MAG: formyltransferase family protein [Patescibacteria group bacterium]
MIERKVNTVLIASGSGTDANAIMQAYSSGYIPNVDIKALISTKDDAGCIDKAIANNISFTTISRRDARSNERFNGMLAEYLSALHCELVFLVGCVVKIFPISGVDIYNIHPADPQNFGGNGMYGLKVHERVLIHVEDLIARGKKTIDDDFFTYPTVHEADFNYDSGQSLINASVKIPKAIIVQRINKEIELTEAAELLQKHVLPYEWMILPTAVTMAAQKILS